MIDRIIPARTRGPALHSEGHHRDQPGGRRQAAPLLNLLEREPNAYLEPNNNQCLTSNCHLLDDNCHLPRESSRTHRWILRCAQDDRTGAENGGRWTVGKAEKLKGWKWRAQQVCAPTSGGNPAGFGRFDRLTAGVPALHGDRRASALRSTRSTCKRGWRRAQQVCAPTPEGNLGGCQTVASGGARYGDPALHGDRRASALRSTRSTRRFGPIQGRWISTGSPR